MELTTTTVDRILERIYAVVVDDDRQRQPRIACQLAMAVDVVLTVENQRSPSKSSKTAVNESPNKSSKMAADKSSKRNSSMSAAAQVSSTAMTKTLKSRTLALVTNDNRECALVLLLMRHRGRRRGEGSDQVPGDDHADNNGKHERNRIADNVSDDTIVIDQCLPVMDDFQCVVGTLNMRVNI